MPLSVTGVPLDILALIKESQSQHGVRNEDFARYHRYLTARIATLRRQTRTQQLPASTKMAAVAAKKQRAQQQQEGGGASYHKDISAEVVMGMADISIGLMMGGAEGNQEATPLHRALAVALSLCPSRRSKAMTIAAAAGAATANTPTVGGALVTPADNSSFAYSPSNNNSSGAADDEAAQLRHQNQLAAAATASISKAPGGKYLELLVLNAERCWAEYEASMRPGTVPLANGGFAPPTPALARKRLNKAVKWCEKLEALVGALAEKAVGGSTGKDDAEAPATAALIALVEYVAGCCRGYAADMRAKCANSHGSFPDTAVALVVSRESFLTAATALCSKALVAALPTSGAIASEAVVALEQAHALLVAKVAELDDRITLLHSSSLNDDVDPDDHSAVVATVAAFRKNVAASAAVPAFVIATATTSATTSKDSTTVAAKPQYITLGGSISWFGRGGNNGIVEVPVHNLRVKASLRSAGLTDPTNIARALTALPAASTTKESAQPALPPLIGLACQRRVGELFDRTIHNLNDALAHARQEGRSVDGAEKKAASQVLLLYLQYQITRKTADRALFLLEVLLRRLLHVQHYIKSKHSSGASAAMVSAIQLAKGYLKLKGVSRVELVQGTSGSVRHYTPAKSKVPVVHPSEMAKMFEAAIRSLDELSHLPGIDGGNAISVSTSSSPSLSLTMEELLAEQASMCKIGQLLCAGASWHLLGVAPSPTASTEDPAAAATAEVAIPQAMQTLSRASQGLEALQQQAASSGKSGHGVLLVTRVGEEVAAANSGAVIAPFFSLTVADSCGLPSVFSPAVVGHLIDSLLISITVALNQAKQAATSSGTSSNGNASAVDRLCSTSPASVFGSLGHLSKMGAAAASIVPFFPASPMPLVPKPVSIDVASTFVTLPRGKKSAASNNAPKATTAPSKGTTTSSGGKTKPAEKEAAGAGGGWLGGWGWKKQ